MANKTTKAPAVKRKPLGDALPPLQQVIGTPSQEEMDLLISLWDTFAPQQYAGMLNAEDHLVLQQTGQEPSGLYVWNATAMTYTNVETGHVVDQDEALAALSAFVKAYSEA